MAADEDTIEVGIPVRVPASVVADPDRYRALVEEVRYVLEAGGPARAYVRIPRGNLYAAWRVLTDDKILKEIGDLPRTQVARWMRVAPAAQVYRAITGCTPSQLTDALIDAVDLGPDSIPPPLGEQS